MTTPENENLHEREHVTDVLDKASQVEAENMEISLQEHARRMRRSQEKRPDGTYEIEECVSCGDEIGMGRLNAAIKNTLCITCATRAERTHRETWNR